MFSPMVAIASEIAVSTVTSPTLAALIFSTSAPTCERDLRDHLDEALELFVAGDEIGLRIDFDDDALGARRHRADQAFRRDAAGLLRRLRQALLAQPILAPPVMSPEVSVSAALQSIMPAPVDSRSSLTIAAEIVAIVEYPSCLLAASTARALRHAAISSRECRNLGKNRWPEGPATRRYNYSASAVSALAWATQPSARLGSPTSSPILCAVS